MRCQRWCFKRFFPLSGRMSGSLAWLLIIFLRNLLRETDGQTPPQGFRYASYEVTIPRKLSFRYGLQETQDVSYLLQIEGKSQVVRLRRKRGTIPKDFPIFTYNKEGDLQVDYHYIRDDCFYSGFIQDKPLSSVTLSTCSGGLRGLLQLKNETYQIEPVQPSATFQHVVYRLEIEEGAMRMRCGLTEEEQRRQEAMIQDSEHVGVKSAPAGLWWPHKRHAEVAFVVEHERYVKFNKNETDIAMKLLETIHTVNSFYESFLVEVSIAGLEIWSEKNLIDIDDSIGVTLKAFSIWSRNTLLNHLNNDAAHLILYKSYGSTIGLAYVGQICSKYWATALEVLRYFNLLDFSSLFAHELGHNLGMPHDSLDCKCDRHACIMAAWHSQTDKFSNCSYHSYFNRKDSPCLLIPPATGGIPLIDFKYCGNKVVDKGEQCDCGSAAQCESDHCCRPNCTLRPCADCSSGLCCAWCKYRPAGSICRKSISTCDLPEFCTGTSDQCPEDVYVQDGAPCGDGVYCYHGRCTTANGQCKKIFGKKSVRASEDCFRGLNARGDRFGNCGLEHGIFKKCNDENILCGRMQCSNIYRVRTLEEHQTIIQTTIGKSICWGTDYHSGMEVDDIGAVEDGTPCGTGMMCINRECKNVSLLQYDCNITKCHNRGICNNHKHCHCSYGWAPPDCLKRGNGGSIDSGPTSRNWNGVIVGSIVGSVLVLCTVTAAVALGVYYRFVLSYKVRRKSSRISPS
ncbi:disintegrin and metalloproteinase domain-containing protein 21-like [Lacerta agilis]|uniref:disintegrin and metalloproteinase domain-containing protein 21-like n=1 Tax=Lacerta agilis TaxID=80427 RepID=UPI001419B5FE|nr:disintegrin and metalloproteinase domain-containing protein 21-like [Lacerta agilis]